MTRRNANGRHRRPRCTVCRKILPEDEAVLCGKCRKLAPPLLATRPAWAT